MEFIDEGFDDRCFALAAGHNRCPHPGDQRKRQRQQHSGLGSGNGNGNGNGNGSNNTTSTSASAGSNNTTSTSASAGGSAVTLNNNRRNAPAITAPSLAAAGIETCLGSNSVGGAGPGFGVTIAGTITDRGCNLRLYSRTLYSMGHKLAATQILCNDPVVAAALALEGVRCLVGPAAEARGLGQKRRPRRWPGGGMSVLLP